MENTENTVGAQCIRRSDVTPSIRLLIAFTALQARENKTWGVITGLARTYAISRTCVYLLATSLTVTCETVFGASLSPMVPCDIRQSYRGMLPFRLEGRCSIGAISTMMKRFGVERSSVGTTSQRLHALGVCLPSALSWSGESVKLVVFLTPQQYWQKSRAATPRLLIS